MHNYLQENLKHILKSFDSVKMKSINNKIFIYILIIILFLCHHRLIFKVRSNVDFLNKIPNECLWIGYEVLRFAGMKLFLMFSSVFRGLQRFINLNFKFNSRTARGSWTILLAYSALWCTFRTKFGAEIEFILITTIRIHLFYYN